MRLYQSVGAGITTRFGYDGVDLIGEYNSSNTLLRRYVHGPGSDEPLVWYEGAGTAPSPDLRAQSSVGGPSPAYPFLDQASPMPARAERAGHWSRSA